MPRLTRILDLLDVDTISLADSPGNSILSIAAPPFKDYANVLGSKFSDTLTGNAGDNILDGGKGADTLSGGAGNDTYYVDNARDRVTEAADGGEDEVVSAVSWTLGAGLEYLTLTGSAKINGTGNQLANEMAGNAAANVLDGKAGDDTLLGGDGNDTLIGGTGNDWLDGEGGRNVLRGGLGDDVYVISAPGDTVAEAAGQGNDTVRAGVSYALGANVENLTLTGEAAINGTGNALDNVLAGNDAANTLDGGAGNDTLIGGGGNDLLRGGTGNDAYYTDMGDTVVEAANGGVDTVYATGSFTLGENVENLTVVSEGDNQALARGNALGNLIRIEAGTFRVEGLGGDDVLQGNAFSWLYGGEGNDLLQGSGLCELYGGAGNDIYEARGYDLVQEAAGNGTDLVRAWNNFTLRANVENLTLMGSGDFDGIGNELGNVITGNDGRNTLRGMFGADVIYGGGGKDVIQGFGGDSPAEDSGNWLYGGAGEDMIVGGSGNDVIDGGSGTDMIYAGAGDDVIRTGGSGNELSANQVFAGAGNDVIYLDGGGARYVMAEDGDDTIYGGNGYWWTTQYSVLSGGEMLGGDGDDRIYGGRAPEIIRGDDGNDELHSGGGNDALYGGAGNDSFWISAGSSVNEEADGGVDTVYAGFTVTLADNVERLVLTGKAAINGTGNAADNWLTGNDGANALYGGDGADKLDGGKGRDQLFGGAGDDTYMIGTSADIVTEAEDGGTDTVWAARSYALGGNVENLTLTGSGNFSGTGNGLANVITGNAGNNVLIGGGGADTIYGGDGNDRLVFTGAGEGHGGAGADIFEVTGPLNGRLSIMDFEKGSDKIDLSALYADYEAFQADVWGIFSDINDSYAEYLLNGGGSIYIPGWSWQVLGAGDFIFGAG